MEQPCTLANAMTIVLSASNPSTLPSPVLEGILVWGVRLRALSMRRPGRSIDDAVGRLVPYLNALPRTCSVHVSHAVIMQCPWIDATTASLTNDLWLLDTLRNMTRAPFHRPMQYNDTELMDKVSGKGFISVLDWWHKSEFIIGHEEPLQAASDHGHVAVLDWWLASGRLGNDFPVSEVDAHSLLEPSRKGDLVTLDWWFCNMLQGEIESTTNASQEIKSQGSSYLTHSFAEVIWVALHANQVHVAHWWIKLCSYYYDGVSDSVMSVLFASGNKQLVDAHWNGYIERGGNLSQSFPYVSFSGDVGFIEYCWQWLEAHPLRNRIQSPLPAMCIYASCAGHVQVLDYLQAKGWVNPSAWGSRPVDLGLASTVWTILPREIVRLGVDLDSGIVTLSFVDILAIRGLVDVLEWWAAHFRDTLNGALQDPEVLLNFISLALVTGHIAVIEWACAFRPCKLGMGFLASSAARAAAHGHLRAVQWYCAQVAQLDPIITGVLYSALLGGRIELCEWILDTYQSTLGLETCRALQLAMEETPRASVVEWCWKNAARLPFTCPSIPFSLYDRHPGRNHSYTVYTKQEMWTFLCMMGATATTRQGNQVTFVASISRGDDDYTSSEDGYYSDDDEEEIIRLFQGWRCYPLFLEQLTTIQRHFGDKPLLILPKQLDLACEGDAGVAVLDWLFNRFKHDRRFKWHAGGYDHLVDLDATKSIEWWTKMNLPLTKQHDSASSGSGDASVSEDTESELDQGWDSEGGSGDDDESEWDSVSGS